MQCPQWVRSRLKQSLTNAKPTEAKSSEDAVTTCYLCLITRSAVARMQRDEHYLTTFFKGFFAASVAATAMLFAVGFVRQAVHPVGITPTNLAAGVLVAFVHLDAIRDCPPLFSLLDGRWWERRLRSAAHPTRSTMPRAAPRQPAAPRTAADLRRGWT